jgi:hypothetical protein
LGPEVIITIAAPILKAVNGFQALNLSLRDLFSLYNNPVM